MSLQPRQKESKGKKTLNYVRNPEELEQFYQDISSFNEEVAKVKDFKDKMIVYNCGEKLMQTSLYFKKDQWQKLYDAFKMAYQAYLEQRKTFAGF